MKERVEHTGIQADKKIQLDSHLLIDVASMCGQFRQEGGRFKVYNLLIRGKRNRRELGKFRTFSRWQPHFDHCVRVRVTCVRRKRCHRRVPTSTSE